jgi:hypothetical protein
MSLNYFGNPYRKRPRFWDGLPFKYRMIDIRREPTLKRKVACALYWFLFLPGYQWYQYYAKYQNHLDYLRERIDGTKTQSKFRRWNRNFTVEDR